MIKKILFSFCLLTSVNILFAQAPSNDLCSDAIPVSCGDSVAGTTINATLDSIASCGTALVTAPSVWYVFSGTGDAVTFSTCSAPGYDTEVGVYSGSCGSLTCVGGNDDACGTLSSVTINTTIGVDYYIVVHGYNVSSGPFMLTVACAAPCSPAVTNDLCSSPENLTVYGSISSCTPTLGTNVCATSSTMANPSCYSPFANAQDVWYSFTTGTTYGVDISFSAVSGANFVYAVYSNCSSPAISCGNTDMNIEGLNNNTTYLIQVLNIGGVDEGTFNICVSADSTALPPPANDFCMNAISITCNTTIVGHTKFGTADTVVACGSSTISNSSGVWYTFTGTGDEVTLSVCDDADFDSQIGVFTGSCNSFTCVAGNNDGSNCANGTSEVTFNSTIGETYFILVHGNFGASGEFTLTSTCNTPCSSFVTNDICSSAINLTVFPDTSSCVSTLGTNECASTTSLPNPSCGGIGNVQDVWYTFTTGITYGVNISLTGVTGSNFSYAIYNDCTSPALVCNNANANIGGLMNNTTYLIQVFNEGGVDEGTFNICVSADSSAIPPPANDLCSNAISISCDTSIVGYTLYGNIDTVPSCLIMPSSPGVWYSFVGTGDIITVSTCDNADYDTQIAVFTGSCGSFSCIANNDDFTNCTGFTSELSFNSVLGTNYYFLVYGFAAYSGTFTLTTTCTVPPPPAPNDLCANSVILPMLTSCTPTNGNVVGATESFPADSCNGFLSPGALDVWYSFVATSTVATIYVNPMFDPVVELLDTCIASGNILDCSDEVGVASETMNPTNLTIGETYYVRVFNYGTVQPVDPNFTICVYEGVPQSVNESSEVKLINIYPNPTTGLLNINYDNSLSGKIYISNNLGQIVNEFQLQNKIDLRNLPSGFYLLTFIGESGNVLSTEKIIIE